MVMTLVLERIETLAQLEADTVWWQIYADAFPPPFQVTQADLHKLFTRPMARFYRGTRNGQTIAMIAVQLLENPAAVFVDYFAVHASARRSGVGRWFLAESMRLGQEDLAALGHEPLGTLLEVEIATEVGRKTNAEAWYRRQGFKSLSFRYRQPALKDQAPVPMRLLFKGAAESLLLTPPLQLALVRALLEQVYVGSYGVDANVIAEELRLRASDLGLEDDPLKVLPKSS